MTAMTVATKRWLAAGVVLTFGLGAATDAVAQKCNYAPPNWSAPKGALVSLRSANTSSVQKALTALGEYRTHSMLSLGPSQLAHLSMYPKPRTGTALCDERNMPLYPDWVYRGRPGAQKINMGAAYSYIYNNDPAVYLRYQNGSPPYFTSGACWGYYTTSGNTSSSGACAIVQNPGARIADWVNQMPSRSAHGATELLMPTSSAYGSYSGKEFAYWLYGASFGTDGFSIWVDPYPNSQIAGHWITIPSATLLGREDGRIGAVCSSFVWALQYWSGVMAQPTRNPPQRSNGYSYREEPMICINPPCVDLRPRRPWRETTHAQTATAITAFRNQAYNSCMEGTSMLQDIAVFFGNVFNACTMTKSEICSQAARQLTNCLVDGKSNCADGSYGTWESAVNNPDVKFKPLSPDRLGGWGSGTPWDMSVWAYDNDYAVSFNGSGSVYGCWRNW